MIKRCMIALVVLSAATAVSAADEKSKDGTEVAEKDKVICKTDRSTGSLTRKKRICRTRAQWDEISAAARKGVDDLVRAADTRSPANTATMGAGGI